ncbi:unnamed protein product [Prorocentrum cordatum]|uniref:RAP domain-containing protein n=1 Tax=Prorocentrum cordatum TaxID=2364126 RepID=A0ABN9Y8X0_9DINO|nr:unnamed protein product [Polarella glacialis]
MDLVEGEVAARPLAGQSGGWRERLHSRRQRGDDADCAPGAVGARGRSERGQQPDGVAFDQRSVLDQDKALIEQLTQRQQPRERPPVKKPTPPPKVAPYRGATLTPGSNRAGSLVSTTFPSRCATPDVAPVDAPAQGAPPMTAAVEALAPSPAACLGEQGAPLEATPPLPAAADARCSRAEVAAAEQAAAVQLAAVATPAPQQALEPVVPRTGHLFTGADIDSLMDRLDPAGAQQPAGSGLGGLGAPPVGGAADVGRGDCTQNFEDRHQPRVLPGPPAPGAGGPRGRGEGPAAPGRQLPRPARPSPRARPSSRCRRGGSSRSRSGPSTRGWRTTSPRGRAAGRRSRRRHGADDAALFRAGFGGGPVASAPRRDRRPRRGGQARGGGLPEARGGQEKKGRGRAGLADPHEGGRRAGQAAAAKHVAGQALSRAAALLLGAARGPRPVPAHPGGNPRAGPRDYPGAADGLRARDVPPASAGGLPRDVPRAILHGGDEHDPRGEPQGRPRAEAPAGPLAEGGRRRHGRRERRLGARPGGAPRWGTGSLHGHPAHPAWKRPQPAGREAQRALPRRLPGPQLSVAIPRLTLEECELVSPTMAMSQLMPDALRRSFLERCMRVDAGRPLEQQDNRTAAPDIAEFQRDAQSRRRRAKHFHNVFVIEACVRKDTFSFFSSLPADVRAYLDRVRTESGRLEHEGPSFFASQIAAVLDQLGVVCDMRRMAGPLGLHIVTKATNPNAQTEEIVYECSDESAYYAVRQDDRTPPELTASSKLRHRLLQRLKVQVVHVMSVREWQQLGEAQRVNYMVKLQSLQ